jgi:DNA ligase-1
MLKDVSKTYTFGRSDSMIKMKLMDTVDLIVTDIYEGDKHSKYEGQMGGVYCDYKGFRLGVGSGWSDEERLHYWKHPNDIIGKTIEVAYQAETSNKQGGLSLSFPVKKKVREDK